MSLIEMVTTAFLLGLSMTAIGELVLLNTVASTKLTNNIDGQTGSSRALRRLAQDVRAAQSIDPASSGQSLILHLPVYTNTPQDQVAGFPRAETPDVVTYSIVADAANPGTYDLTLLRTTSDPVDGRPTINPAEVVLTGIIGPNTTPGVFSYITPQPLSGASYGPVPPAASPPLMPSAFIGVYVNLQVRTPPNGFGTNVKIVGTHLEAYLKASTALASGLP